MSNSASLKKRIRARMAATGEKYTVAMRAGLAERDARMAARQAGSPQTTTGQPDAASKPSGDAHGRS